MTTLVLVVPAGCIQDVHQQQLRETHDPEGAPRRQELRALPAQPGPGGVHQQVRRRPPGAAARLGDQDRPPGQGEWRMAIEKPRINSIWCKLLFQVADNIKSMQ